MPIRLRLALTFAAMMLVLFGVLFLLLYTRYAAALDDSINSSLQTQAADLAVIAGESHARLATHRVLPEGQGGFAQILDAHGRVLAATPGLGDRSLLTPAELRQTLRGTVNAQRDGAQLRASRVAPQGGAAGTGRSGDNVLTVGVSLADRGQALDTLQTVLFVGGPIALLLACAAGYLVAARALAPVESMRRRAARMFRFESSERLPVPPAHDELQALGTTLNEMLARVDDVVGRGRAFVAGASHELRSPLTILQLELDDALSGERSKGELTAAVSSAREEVRRLTSLTEDLLVLAQADQARLPIRYERFDVCGALRVLAARYEHVDELPGGSVRVQCGEPMLIEADVAWLDQALGNLVDNALRFSDGPVTLSARRRAANVELHVLDSGPGFPPEFLPHAFERFSRADPSRSRRGTGLGLSIVSAIAEAHGGRVNVENRSGGGADAWLTLPIVAPREAPYSAQTPVARPEPLPRNG
jgi:signal transduction histidine kinase